MGAGALNALGVHGSVAALRGASTVTTAGFGNPFVSLAEDALAVFATALAFFAPYVGAALAVLVTIALVLVARAILRATRAPASASAGTNLTQLR
jgi:hypothetical protein